jgi:squalene cyclase
MKKPVRRRSRFILPAAVCALAALSSATSALGQEGGTVQQGTEARTPPPEGVTPQVELAIERGLTYLVKEQASDGSWLGEGGAYPVAMTALAGLALLSNGSTATRGPLAPPIRRASDFLLRQLREDGLFTAGGEERPMYGHAFTMMFLSHVLGEEESLERREEIKAALRQAVKLAIRAQSKDGGWYYTPNWGYTEGTLTVTLMQGLRACRDAGIHVPKKVIDLAVKYIEDSALPSGAVLYQRSATRNEPREGVTCASVVALWSAGRYEDPLLKRIAGYMDRNIQAQWNTGRRHATYVQYYLAQAKFLLGGDRWSRYYRTESQLMVQDQEQDGSWLTQEERWNHGVGAVYSTSIGLIVLQLPYNRLPIFQR